jgi:nitrous oxidase accessory protein NosD
LSYTLRGRVESRLAAAALPFLVACVLAAALPAWWPLELAGLMVGAGLALDVLYDRLLDYQPGWLAVPLGALELMATMALALALDVGAPLRPALAFFAAAWLVAQLLGHAGFPLLHLTYAEDGGELGRAGRPLAAAAPLALLAVAGTAWTLQPPTVHLQAGVHEGPLVLDRAQKLVGDDGAVVRGGIVVTADDVTVRNVAVFGGENGIDVDGADDVVLEDVTVSGAQLDGIHVRRSSVAIRDCRIVSSHVRAQGIDISFGFDLDPSLVEGCTIVGGQEGIVSHFSMVRMSGNHVRGTTLRALTMTEMSMGEIKDNDVLDAVGVGIYCGDYSECHVEDNTVVGTRPDRTSDDHTRTGYAIQAHYGAVATLHGNRISRSADDHGAFAGARVVHD